MLSIDKDIHTFENQTDEVVEFIVFRYLPSYKNQSEMIKNDKEMIEKYPEEMVERAVKGMLPHNRLGRAMGKKLFVYRDANHKHEAQKPKALEIN